MKSLDDLLKVPGMRKSLLSFRDRLKEEAASAKLKAAEQKSPAWKTAGESLLAQLECIETLLKP